MKIKVINRSKHKLPEYATENSAGKDLRANLESKVILKPMEKYLVPTGLFLEVPVGYEAQIRSGNGLVIKKGVTVLNSPVIIEADDTGEVCVILVNLSNENFVIEDGERICQMIISKHEKAEWDSVENLMDYERGSGGFGHTGKK